MRAPSLRRAIQAGVIAAGLLSSIVCAPAQTMPGFNASRANKGTLGVVSGGADGTYIRIAADLANVLDNKDLRILPMIGRGSLQNLKDIMFLRGVDIGIVQMDAREQLKAENLQDDAIRRLRFITRLYNEEVHIIASREITDIRQLEGKKVNIDKAGSGTNLTARLIFDKLGIKPELTTFDQAASYAKLKSGEIQAALYVAGRPVRAIAEFQTDGQFHLLPIPFEGEIAESYFPARFETVDYPQLVAQDKPVDTLAVGSLLAVYNWPENTDRYNRVKRFVDAFFSRFDEFLQPGRHPKWKEVNLAADVPGWERIKAAQDWLDRAATAGKPSPEEQTFESFMESRGIAVSAEQREALFQDFLAWRNDRQRASRRALRQD
ncbi:TAXI family TRAP transporter solute-binding subunit [Microvirga makkahensis]|uniref:TAXI family TRAP transporter solute-binding subunit n=1 Tax=Microvirga makkahensis TaxID=1128670 RepID=A0A7X3MWX0_9HYPH|nr:TAXI family TRAP transporter solute-binding subunit [Microvirga makkahensis]MXQ14727.1 TAXI family TRAP transporter solute-binding subunit [Microvirga makkahensis]